MIDNKQVDRELGTTFTVLALRACNADYAVGSTSEQSIGTAINGRAGWLPKRNTNLRQADERLHAGGTEWSDATLYGPHFNPQLVPNQSATSRRLIGEEKQKYTGWGAYTPGLPLCALRAGRSRIRK